MQERKCGGCQLWLTANPAAFEGQCCYFPPQLAREAGRLVNVRPITTREDGCHIGFRPRQVLPASVPLEPGEAEGVVSLVRQGAEPGGAP